jgi:hypothetical protein
MKEVQIQFFLLFPIGYEMLVGTLGEQFGDVAVKKMCTVAQMYIFFHTAYVQNDEKRNFAAVWWLAAGSVNFANR